MTGEKSGVSKETGKPSLLSFPVNIACGWCGFSALLTLSDHTLQDPIGSIDRMNRSDESIRWG